MPRQSQRWESDIDVAILAREPVDVESRMELIAAIARSTGNPVDLQRVREPLLGEILTRGVRILVRDELAYADLIRRHLLDAADFRPLRDRILEERRTRWTDERSTRSSSPCAATSIGSSLAASTGRRGTA